MDDFDLYSVLRGYAPADEVEAGHLQKVLRLLDEYGDNAFSRDNPPSSPGHITGSAFIFSENLGEVLLLHHKKLDKWLQPGGHADGDTDIPRVILREVLEETGLGDVKVLQFPADVDVHVFAKEPVHLHHDIRAFVSTRNKNFCGNHESNTLRWFTFDEARKLHSDADWARVMNKWKNLH